MARGPSRHPEQQQQRSHSRGPQATAKRNVQKARAGSCQRLARVPAAHQAPGPCRDERSRNAAHVGDFPRVSTAPWPHRVHSHPSHRPARRPGPLNGLVVIIRLLEAFHTRLSWCVRRTAPSTLPSGSRLTPVQVNASPRAPPKFVQCAAEILSSYGSSAPSLAGPPLRLIRPRETRPSPAAAI